MDKSTSTLDTPLPQASEEVPSTFGGHLQPDARTGAGEKKLEANSTLPLLRHGPKPRQGQTGLLFRAEYKDHAKTLLFLSVHTTYYVAFHQILMFAVIPSQKTEKYSTVQ